MTAEYDEGGSIGKRYRRQDEIGTPWGVTVDHQTLEDRTVTLRDRDSLEQVRIAIDELGDELERSLRAEWRSPKLPPPSPAAAPCEGPVTHGLDRAPNGLDSAAATVRGSLAGRWHSVEAQSG